VGGADNLSEQDDMPDETADDDFALEPPAGPRPTKTRKPRAAKGGGQVELTHYSHSEKRKNNPEVGMVNAAIDPDQPSQHWAYDPHIDPALQFDSQRSAIESLIDDALASGDTDVMRDALAELKRLQVPYLNWAGKAERTSFDVDTVSLHVHERIDPATILAGIRKQVAAGPGGVKEEAQPWLFDPPFEALPLRQALDFYGHDKGWANRLVAGDSLLVMNSLLHKESMAGQVQMIFFDPPYGITYGSNFQPFTGKHSVKDRVDADLTQEPEMIKAFRDTWELGIHSYLTYLRDRLLLARDLLNSSGSIFVQIGDENVHHVRELMDEIFGTRNIVSQIAFVTTTSQTSKHLPPVADYILWYAKDKKKLKHRPILQTKDYDAQGSSAFALFEHDGKVGRKPTSRPGEKLLVYDNLTSRSGGESSTRPFAALGQAFKPTSGGWKTGELGLQRLHKAGRIGVRGEGVFYVRYFDDFPYVPMNNIWRDTQSGGLGVESRVYVVQTNVRVIERCMLMSTDPGDLVLDPTCGSGTTAYCSEKWGRRWITCDTSRVAITLAKQRLLTASFDYYNLRYPAEGLSAGFQYKVVPHVMLSSIAGKAGRDVEACFDKLHPLVESRLEMLNGALTGTPLRFTIGVGARRGKEIKFDGSDSDTYPIKETEFTSAFALLQGECEGEAPEGWPSGLIILWEKAAKDPENESLLAALNSELRGVALEFRTRKGWMPGRNIRFDAPDDAVHSRIVDRSTQLNAFLEWEPPFDPPADWPLPAQSHLADFHQARQTLRQEMERIIASHAEPETLFDRPDTDPGKLRVTGPFTVEAVPSPIVATFDRQAPAADASIARSGETARQADWRSELLKTGIRGKGGQMLQVAGLEVIPGCRHLHASGALADDGSRVVVSFGPEHAALEQRQVERALEEAQSLIPSPKLVVFCAFTFDPEAAKDIDEAKWPGVTLLKAQMNPDLLTEDLKKARASNQSFWLMGQPDVEVRKVGDRWQVQVNGFDYFDTKSGDLVSGGKKNIAMWSLDTDYDGRAVFPRQTFFPMAGAKDGWNRLKANIRAELDAGLLDQFNGTQSLPFDAGEHRRIAVKIVDDRGIESLKIVPLDD
jgi:DNA modification methylase